MPYSIHCRLTVVFLISIFYMHNTYSGLYLQVFVLFLVSPRRFGSNTIIVAVVHGAVSYFVTVSTSPLLYTCVVTALPILPYIVSLSL